jgi:putative PIN family toxin of toxin-antitoxin system
MTPVIPRAVFDCVVLLQAAVSKKGPAFACLQLAQAGQLLMMLSPDVLAEVTDVLNRPELRRKFKTLTTAVAGAFLRDLTDCADFISEVPAAFAYPRDPDDEPQINLAVASGARYLVTWDNDLLELMDEATPAGAEFRQRFPVTVHSGVDGVVHNGVRAYQDVHQWLSIGRSRHSLLPAIPPARDLLRLRVRRLLVAFDLQTSRSPRTLHLRTQPTGSPVLLQLPCGNNDGASPP